MAQSFDETILLLGLGAPRTGTRWMSAYFASHPEILMSPLRVLHYFDARFLPGHGRFGRQFEDRLRQVIDRGQKNDALRDRVRMITDESAYLDYFRNQWSEERVLCDITPSYCHLDERAFAAMHEAHATVRFLFTMRNPIDRLWSGAAREAQLHGGGSLKTRYEAFERQLASNTSGVDYVGTCTRLERAAPTRSIRYMFFEQMFEARSIEDLCAFLPVRPVAANFQNVLNQSAKAPLDDPLRRRAYRLFEETYHFVHDKFDGRIPESWIHDMARYTNS